MSMSHNEKTPTWGRYTIIQQSDYPIVSTSSPVTVASYSCSPYSSNPLFSTSPIDSDVWDWGNPMPTNYHPIRSALILIWIPICVISILYLLLF